MVSKRVRPDLCFCNFHLGPRLIFRELAGVYNRKDLYRPLTHFAKSSLTRLASRSQAHSTVLSKSFSLKKARLLKLAKHFVSSR